MRDTLIQAAQNAREGAYAPYSHFRVGAALLTEDGRVYTGANVESASYGATVCAERAALVKAVNDGARSFAALAVASDGGEPVTPCGICRQHLAEFGDMDVICVGANGMRVWRLSELLPHGFTLKQE